MKNLIIIIGTMKGAAQNILDRGIHTIDNMKIGDTN